MKSNIKDVLKKYFKKPSKNIIIIYSIGISIVILCFLILYVTIGKNFTAFVTDTESFKQWLNSYKQLNAVIFIFIRAFQTVIKIIPAEPLEIASGYIFGTWGGLILCSLGTFLGSLVIVILSKWLGTKFIQTFVNEEQLQELKFVNDKKKQRAFLIMFYLIPGTPKDILTYVAGSLKINLIEFFVITTIARIPSIITSTLCGYSAAKGKIELAIIIFVATAVMTMICGMFYRKIKRKNKNNKK